MRRLGTGTTMLLGRSDVPSWTRGGRQVRIQPIKVISARSSVGSSPSTTVVSGKYVFPEGQSLSMAEAFYA